MGKNDNLATGVVYVLWIVLVLLLLGGVPLGT